MLLLSDKEFEQVARFLADIASEIDDDIQADIFSAVHFGVARFVRGETGKVFVHIPLNNTYMDPYTRETVDGTNRVFTPIGYLDRLASGPLVELAIKIKAKSKESTHD